MQRSRRLTATGTLLVGLSIALIGAVAFAVTNENTAGQIPHAVPTFALLILGALLTIYLWQWLRNHMNSSSDLPAFLIVMFAGVFVVGIAIAYGNDSEKWLYALPLTTAVICFSLLDLTRKRLEIKSHTVKGGTVAVIQRNGAFDRLEDPGRIFLTGNNEEVAYTLSTVDQARTIKTSVLHMGALTYGYVLRVHYRLTPRSLVDPDDNKLQHLNSIADVRETIQEAVQEAIERAEQTYDVGAPETYRNDWFGSLLRIRPYTPMRRTFLQAANQEIAQSLSPKGIEWDSQRELTVSALRLPMDLIAALTPSEYDRLLKLHNTSMDSASRNKLYTWIVQADPLDIPFSIDTATPPPHRIVDPPEPPVRTRPLVKLPKPSLSPEDLSIMKTIPG